MDEYRLAFAESILRRYQTYRNEGRIPKAIKLAVGELQLLRDFLDDELILIEGPDEERILGMAIIETLDVPPAEDRFAW